jgi:hypothetical protein
MDRPRRVASIIALLVALGACGTHATRTAPAREATRLLLVIVIDQLGASTLARHRGALDAGGILARAMDGGLAYRLRFDHATTLTAPGHVAVFTGGPPRESGVGNNAYWDRDERRLRRIFDDGRKPIEGLPKVSASPHVLTLPTLADLLVGATAGRGKVVALSLKDRGAIPAGGGRPDALLFYEASLGRFTTSHAHAPGLLDGLPLEVGDERLAPWLPLDAALYEARLGPDDGEGEMDEHGMGVTFPHRPRDTDAPLEAYAFTPAATDHLVELALALARRLELGADDVPDLLAISISGTDYAGHQHGPMSWEYLDHLIRADRALTSLVEGLGGLERVTVAITSDHGAAPMPTGQRGVRLDPEAVAVGLEASLVRELGTGPHLEAFVPPWLYLRSDDARRAAKVAHIVDEVSRTRGLLAAYDPRDAARLAVSADPLERAVGVSIPEGADFDVYLVTSEEGFFAVGVGGTSHGGPHPEEREVPGLVIGPGVGRATSVSPRSMRDFHSTLKALLGLGSDEDRPLPGTP